MLNIYYIWFNIYYFILALFILFIYLFILAVPCLSCGMQDLRFSMWAS